MVKFVCHRLPLTIGCRFLSFYYPQIPEGLSDFLYLFMQLLSQF